MNDVSMDACTRRANPNPDEGIDASPLPHLRMYSSTPPSLRLASTDSAPDSGSTSTSTSPASASGGREATLQEPTSPVAPLAAPPASTRTRAPEFYGFVAWTGTYLLFAAYLLWAFLPDARIHALGVSWYPNRCVLSPPPAFPPAQQPPQFQSFTSRIR